MSSLMWVFTAVIVLFALIGTAIIYLDNKKHSHVSSN